MQEARNVEESPYRFSNDVVFSYVMQDPEICKGVLEAVLGRKVGSIDYVDSQHTIAGGVTVKDIRLDVMLDGEDAVYDVEMQVSRQDELVKRCRYYQARMDSRQLGKGDDYELLRESYVIFLCAFDHFKLRLPVYTIEPRCLESAAAEPKAGQSWILLNSLAWERAERPELSELLEYVKTSRTGDSPSGLIRSIEEKVRESQEDDAVRGQLMLTLEQKRKAEREGARAEGRAQGLAEGEARRKAQTSKLKAAMAADGRIGEFLEAIDDDALFDRLADEFGIE